MDSRNSFSNSPLNQKNTPTKRLGLSRKRKSCSSDSNLSNKIQACSEKFPSSPLQILKTYEVKMKVDKGEISSKSYEGDSDDNYNERTDCIKEVDLVKKRISQKEEKLKALQKKKKRIDDLENLVDVWKNGCKNAFLHLTQLLKERQTENIELDKLLKKLGIWETMVENFESDSDISLSDSIQ